MLSNVAYDTYTTLDAPWLHKAHFVIASIAFAPVMHGSAGIGLFATVTMDDFNLSPAISAGVSFRPK